MAAFVILAATIVLVVRYIIILSCHCTMHASNFLMCHMARRKAGVVVNMITVHNYGESQSGDNESDTGSIPEQIIIVEEETTNNELSINNDKLNTEQCKINLWNDGNNLSDVDMVSELEREQYHVNEVPKLDLVNGDVMNDGTIFENECHELITASGEQHSYNISNYYF